MIKLKCAVVDPFGTRFRLGDKYYKYRDDSTIVLTNDLATAINKLGQDNISGIEEYGVGYVIEGEETNKEE